VFGRMRRGSRVHRPGPLVALGLALALAGCELVFPATPDPNGLLQRELQTARATWLEHAIDDYHFTVRFGCFCPDTITGPFVVTVVDGAMTEIRRQDGRPLGDPGRLTVPLTIDQAFQRAADALDADEVTIAWDPQWGFPTEITVNPRLGAVDEEYSITITDFVVLS
jgi:hypothetical protein